MAQRVDGRWNVGNRVQKMAGKAGRDSVDHEKGEVVGHSREYLSRLSAALKKALWFAALRIATAAGNRYRWVCACGWFGHDCSWTDTSDGRRSHRPLCPNCLKVLK